MFDSDNPASSLASQPHTLSEDNQVFFSLASVDQLQTLEMNEDFVARKLSASFQQVPMQKKTSSKLPKNELMLDPFVPSYNFRYRLKLVNKFYPERRVFYEIT
jgi:hypothetical protein